MEGCSNRSCWTLRLGFKRYQSLPKLKRLDLSYSEKLTRIPDLSQSPNIEEIILSHCPKLIKVHSSILLTKLTSLRLDRCYNLNSVTVPSNILSRSPGSINLSCCSNLEMFSTSQTPISYSPPSSSLIGPIFPHVKLGRQLQRGHSIEAHSATSENPSRSYYSRIFSITYWEADEEKEVTNNNIYLYDEMSEQLFEGVSLNFRSPKELCFLDLSNCSSLTIFPFDLSEMKFLKELYLSGCSKLEYFPEIEDTMENLAVLILDDTAIQALPSSLWRLVGLQQLSLRDCRNLEIIPSSIGSLTRLCKLDLTYCELLQSFPNTIFKLKLRNLDLCGCFKLRTFPEITEPTQTFTHINLTETAIKYLPSSFDNLVNLRSLQLNKCRDLESLPNSIVNLKHLCKLDCSGCAKLTEIPTHIGSLWSLMELSLSESGIVNLPESIAHLSSMILLDLSDCKNLECIPQIPLFLKQLVALDCTSIRRVMSNRNLSDSKEDVFIFHLTNAQQLDLGARANIEEDARLRMTHDAYTSVFFCFPASAIPHWFPFRSEGPSVTINEDLSFCSDGRLIGFALCVVFGVLDTNDINSRYSSFVYSLTFECDDDGTQIIPNSNVLDNYFPGRYSHRVLDKDHIFMWKFNLESLRGSSMNLRLCDARSFTFEIDYNFEFEWSDYVSFVTIKECGMCPLYSSESNVAESSR
ncbi:Disease resistance protein [Vigna angularis]|uniref:Disease resistance protein n=1 Tax=Phaseolus angularis TaxID=3914 RepID=A0A8T0LJS9_PHAAN|nr:Disease resistance protein [Vigna angularis]